MQQHRFDPLSFIFGLLFVAVAGVALVGGGLIAFNDLAWIAPAVLVVTGAILLLSTARRTGSDDAPGSEHDGEVDRAQASAADAPDVGSGADRR